MKLKDLTKKLKSKQRQGPGGKMLDYIDARQVMDLLDDVVGPENWQCDYKEIAGKIYCGVGINAEGWVWKWDMGEESEFSPGKGEASDAFKRAAVKWGVGRFLYKEAEPTEGPKKDIPVFTAPEKGDGFGDLGKCEKCGAPNRRSKAGKLYCSKICWDK